MSESKDAVAGESSSPKKTTPEEMSRIPHHMRMDYERKNRNIDAGKELCDHCSGTGNEFLSMYHKCPECKGEGHTGKAVSK